MRNISLEIRHNVTRDQSHYKTTSNIIMLWMLPLQRNTHFGYYN